MTDTKIKLSMFQR